MSEWRESANRRREFRQAKAAPEVMPGKKGPIKKKRFGLRYRSNFSGTLGRPRIWREAWYETRRGRDDALKAYNRPSYGMNMYEAEAIKD